MSSGWDKVTRWAGIGNNEKDELKDGEDQGMVDEVNQSAEGDPEAETGETIGSPEAQSEPAEVTQLRTERDQLKLDLANVNDRLARLHAEFDNARKRSERERLTWRDDAVGSTVEPFLAVMDNFSLALKAKGSIEQLRGGVELIVKQMEEALRGLNVTAVETIGAEFDPRVHEALGSVETAEFPDHQVIEEIRRGYKIREKLLRPAMVRIAVNSAQVND